MTVETPPIEEIWVDATGCLSWGPQPPVGVIRVESELVKAALCDPTVGVAYIDLGTGRFRKASQTDIDYLSWLYDGASTRPESSLQFFGKQLKFSSKETPRRIAAALAGSRQGLTYQFMKTALKTALSIANLGRKLKGKVIGERTSNALTDGSVFVSQMSNQKQQFFKVNMKSPLAMVHLVHDIIGLKTPELVPQRQTRRLEKFIRHALSRGDHLISVSKGTETDLKNWLSKQTFAHDASAITNCQLSELGIDEKGEQTAIDVLDGKSFVLYCSSFNQRKNHDFMVEVWAELYQRLGNELPQLVFIGRAEPPQQMVSALENAGAAKSLITNLGELAENELRWAYKNADFCVFPSSEEGWGLGVSESLRFGTPVIHTDQPQLCEAAQNTMPALPNRDLNAWTGAIERILTDQNALAKLRRQVDNFNPMPETQQFSVRFLSIVRQIHRHRSNVVRSHSSAISDRA